MAKQRLHKILAERGLASRRAAERLISAGQVAVNGLIVKELGAKADAANDSITVSDQPLPLAPPLRYILLHKPMGYLCSVKDEHGKKSVLGLLPQMPQRLYPVGRLDYNSSGLLLLTNDGALTNNLLHPSREVEKTYLAKVAGPVSSGDLLKLRQGVWLEDGLTAPAQVVLKQRGQGSSTLEITIHEGRKRQVRRMCEQIGHPIRQLTRLRFGSLCLGRLKPGEWRDLSPRELLELRRQS
ncbi:MAG: rRNA pseudouridine synthase [Clostridiales bacterium]|nr:rRNA pseudouridine synthase [Clostridiales bacterium]